MKSNVNSAGFPFIGLLQLAFIILKLCKVITWKWIWVLCPLWGSIILGIVCAIAVVTILLYKALKEQQKR